MEIVGAQEILFVRSYVSDSEELIDDEELVLLLQEGTSPEDVASKLWTRRAAETAELVDVTENSSSRKLSDIHKNALNMAKHYRDRSDQLLVTPTTFAPRTRAIVRP